MSKSTPWHKRGLRVHKLVYRGWYIGLLLMGACIIVSALAPAILLALGAVTDTLEMILTGIAAAVMAQIGALVAWLAIHRLRKPVKATP